MGMGKMAPKGLGVYWIKIVENMNIHFDERFEYLCLYLFNSILTIKILVIMMRLFILYYYI